MPLHDRPDAPGVREIRRAVVQQDGRAQDQPTGDEPGSHHPAEIGEPPHEIARLEVEAVRQILRRLHGEAAVHVHRALRPAGRTGRVDDHVRIFGGHIGECLSDGAPARHHVVPPHVALARAHLAAEPPDDDDRTDARSVGGEVGRLFHLHHLAAAPETVGGDEHARLAVAQAARDRVRGVS